jgi:hypothetical protein
MTIVNDDSSINSEQSLHLNDNARGVIYENRMFIIQAIGVMNLVCKGQALLLITNTCKLQP